MRLTLQTAGGALFLAAVLVGIYATFYFVAVFMGAS